MRKIILLLLFISILSVFAQSATPPSAGSGTEADPYKISTLNELYWIGTDTLNLDKSYVLMNNIDASETQVWFDNTGWIPIGDEVSPFTGVFNGLGYSIDRLTIVSSSGSECGFFGYLADSAVVRDFGMTNVFLSGSSWKGGIAGECNNSSILNCYCTGKILGGGGGIAGKAENNSEIKECYSICLFSGSYTAGGLVGYVEYSADITDCYSFSNIIGPSNFAGGILGRNSLNSPGLNLSNCFHSGMLTETGEWGRGIVGWADTSAVINKCYWDTLTTGLVSGVGYCSSGEAYGKTTGEMQSSSTYTGWDFTEVWDINGVDNMKHPFLRLTPVCSENVVEISGINLGDDFIDVDCSLLYKTGPDIIQHGICWNTEGDPEITDNKTQLGYLDNIGSFTSAATGIASDIDYYFKAYVTTSEGTKYSRQISERIVTPSIVYHCVTTTGTDLNFVGLPLETGWTSVSDLDSTSNNIDAVTKWNAEFQGWETTGYHPSLGWCNDFPVETGGAYLINALNDFDFVVKGDSARVVYDLITTPEGGLNAVIIPLTEPDLVTIGAVGDEIYSNWISSWAPVTQTWNTATKFFGWSNDHLVYTGQPLWANITSPSAWPDYVKKEPVYNNTEEKSIKSSKGGGVPRVVYFHIQDLYGNEIDLLSNSIDFKAWIKERGGEYEFVTDDDFGSGLTDVNGISVAYLNLNSGDLYTPWSDGETLIIQPMTHNPDSLSYSCVLDNSASPIFLGFEPLIAGSGEPVRLDMEWKPCDPVVTIVNSEGTVVTVSWEEYWKATGYNLYWSDDPYDGFEYVTTTTETSWQFSVVGSKKFYRVTAVY